MNRSNTESTQKHDHLSEKIISEVWWEQSFKPNGIFCSRHENQCQMSVTENFLTSSKFDKLFCTYVHSNGPQLHDLLAIYVTK